MATHSEIIVPASPYEVIFTQAIQPVYLVSNLVLALSENGGGSHAATITSGAYTNATFATALHNALNAASTGLYNYTVVANSGIGVVAGTSTFGTSYTVSNSNSGGTFTIA